MNRTLLNVLLATVLFLHIDVGAYAKTPIFPQTKINFKVENVNLLSAIEKLIGSTDYNIVFSDKDIDLKQPISVDLNGTTVEAVLKHILNKANLSYVIKDKSIVISKKETAAHTPIKSQVKIKGQVLDNANKKPIAGATILVINTIKGAITDENGNFTLDADTNSNIEISFIGYNTQVVPIKTNRNGEIIILLKQSTIEIDDIIVNGYAKTTKSRITGSVAVIGEEELKSAPLQNMDMLMQGKVAGVYVQATSGKPGETAKIRIRGTSTITGNAEPLWVVDGVILSKDIPAISTSQVKNSDFSSLFTNGISGINPNDIESITVLKDASAAAIYGSRAAGGVIVVTTKKGTEGKMQVSYSGGLSVLSRPVRDIKLMNSKEKIEFEKELWDEYASDLYSRGADYPVVGIVGIVRSGYGRYGKMNTVEREAYINELSKSTTNWFDELFRTSISHNHHLSFSGGSEKVKYYVSTGYSNYNGLVKQNVYDKYNLNSNINFKANNNISINFTTSVSYQTSKDASAAADLFSYAYFANPYEKPYNEDGSYRPDETYFELGKANGNAIDIKPEGGINIMRELKETFTEVKSFAFTQNVSLNWNIINNLRFEGIGSLSYTNNNSDNINGQNTYTAFLDRPFEGNASNSQRKYGSITQSAAYNTSYSFRGQFAYSKDFREHYISGLVGSEIRKSFSQNIFEKRYGYDNVSGNSSFPVFPSSPSGNLTYDELVQYAAIMDRLSGQTRDENAVASFYFSADYTYSNRYTVSLTARTDGSNNFGSNEQFNPIWSLGGTWNVINENFMSGLKKYISSMSVRLATGYTGNINRSVYPQFIMNYESDFRKTELEFFRKGTVRNAPNPNLRWEKTNDYKVALDMGFLKNRLKFQVEYYNRLSTDVVTGVAVPLTTGFSTQSYNTSEVRNEGIEFTLYAKLLDKKDYSLSISGNASYNKNILEKYDSPNGGIYGNLAVGYPLNSYYTGIYEGIDRYTGVYLFKARTDAQFNNREDYRDASNYYFYVGTQNAPLTGGFSISGSYKRLMVSVGGNYAIGGKILNKINSPATYNSISKPKVSKEPVPTQKNDLYRNHLNVLKDSRNRWTPQNQITDGYPRLIDVFAPEKDYETYMTSSSTITDGVYVEKGTYFKINSIMLSYSLSEKFVKKIGIGSLGISATINNILTLSKYSGFDPETPGIVYPQSKSFSLSVNIGF